MIIFPHHAGNFPNYSSPDNSINILGYWTISQWSISLAFVEEVIYSFIIKPSWCCRQS